MFIKGTDKIKGVLELPTIGIQLSKGSMLPINDSDFWKHDVQTALRMGFIVSAGNPQNPIVDAAFKKDRIVKCKNTHIRSITLESHSSDIKAGEYFYLKESSLNLGDIRAAVGKGIISVIEIVGEKDDQYKEQTLNLKAMLEGEIAPTPQSTEPGAAAVTPSESLTPAQKALLNADKKTQKYLETNEEISGKPQVTDKPKSRPANEPGQAVVWNPPGNPVINQPDGAVVALGDSTVSTIKTRKNSLSNAIRTNADASPNATRTEIVNGEEVVSPAVEKITKRGSIAVNVIDDPNPPPVDPNEGDPRNKAIVVNPHGAQVTNTMKDATVWQHQNDPLIKSMEKEEIEFVDAKEAEARRMAHPKLKDQPPPQNEEIEFVG